MNSSEPTHLVPLNDDRSLCGIRRPTPCVAHFHSLAHIRGYGLRVCADCVATLGTAVDLELAAAVARPPVQMEMAL